MDCELFGYTEDENEANLDKETSTMNIITSFYA